MQPGGKPVGPSLKNLIDILVATNDSGAADYSFRYEGGRLYCDIWQSPAEGSEERPKVVSVVEVELGLRLLNQSKVDFDKITGFYGQ